MRVRRDGQKFWKGIKKTRPKSPAAPIIDLAVWKAHFEGVFNAEKRLNEVDKPEVDEKYIHELDGAITKEEIQKAIVDLRPGKAAGRDDICGEFETITRNSFIFLGKIV